MASIDELAERIEALENELRAHAEAGARWSATVNELNNLVAAVKGHAQLVQMQPTTDKVQELVKVILSSTSRVQELIRCSVQQAEVKTGSADRAPRLADPSTRRILVVDDEVLMRSLLYELLLKAGYNVAMASSGQDAIRECEGRVFDLILMDYRLGDMDGVQALRRIREFQTQCQVVFLTGDPSIEEVRSVVLKEGADGFITKPFDIQEIIDVVEHVLQARDA